MKSWGQGLPAAAAHSDAQAAPPRKHAHDPPPCLAEVGAGRPLVLEAARVPAPRLLPCKMSTNTQRRLSVSPPSNSLAVSYPAARRTCTSGLAARNQRSLGRLRSPGCMNGHVVQSCCSSSRWHSSTCVRPSHVWLISFRGAHGTAGGARQRQQQVPEPAWEAGRGLRGPAIQLGAPHIWVGRHGRAPKGGPTERCKLIMQLQSPSWQADRPGGSSWSGLHASPPKPIQAP